jgi:ion channel
MRTATLVAGVLLLGTVLWDAFETIVLPRTAMRKLRLASVYYRISWRGWMMAGRGLRSDARRERYLAIYGPLSVIGLLIVWAIGLITAFALMRWSRDRVPFVDVMYRSATTLFTLGSGEGLPHSRFERLMIVVEAGAGIGLLTMVFAYLPVIYQSFSRREVRLTLLDAWAGSPPAAAEVLQRAGAAGDRLPLDDFFREWEYWCSEVLESHISYPALAYFRSQHQRQSWISALTTVLDVSALTKVGIGDVSAWRAHLTFAIARHAAVDLVQVFGMRPEGGVDRLPPDERAALRRDLEAAGLKPNDSPDADAELERLRRSYEPYVAALSNLFLVPLPPWRHGSGVRFNWHTSPKRDGGAHL